MQLSNKFVPSDNAAALIAALAGSATQSGNQRCMKQPLGDIGGYRYYKMLITGRDYVTAGGITVTFMTTFATNFEPRITLGGDNVYGYINASAPTTSQFLLSASAANYYVEWHAEGLWSEAL